MKNINRPSISAKDLELLEKKQAELNCLNSGQNDLRHISDFTKDNLRELEIIAQQDSSSQSKS